MSDKLIHLNRAVVVEGKYDKIKLSSFIDGVIIVTNGFRLFKDKEKQELIRFYAQKTGLIIMTDSDTAGFKIRGMIKNITKNCDIINVYIPEIFGKEKRKSEPSKEGKLGVEGLDKQVLIDALERAGVFCEKADTNAQKVTIQDFFDDGLTGKPNSATLRKSFLKLLNLPQAISTKALLEIVNTIMSFEEYKENIKRIDMQIDMQKENS